MKQALLYSIKVWLTTVSIAPLMYCMALSVADKESILAVRAYAGSWPVACIMYTILFIGVSFLPWVVYFLTIWLLNKFTDLFTTIRWLATILGEVILIISFSVLYWLEHGNVDYLYYLMFTCFALVLAVCTRFYKFNQTSSEQDQIQTI
jgi:hypothetical protein